MPSKLPAPGRVVVLGGRQGTREAPRAMGNLACSALALGYPVVVGLDVPGSAQAGINTWMVSAGSATDQKALLGGSPWTDAPELQDGRTSRAVFDLLERLRKLGKGVSVVALDAGLTGDKDSRMAATMAATMTPEAFGVVYVDEHASEFVPVEEPPGTFAWQLSESFDVVPLRVKHGPGTRWGCSEDGCGEITLRGLKAGNQPSITLSAEVRAGFRGTLSLPTSRSSAPAVK